MDRTAFLNALKNKIKEGTNKYEQWRKSVDRHQQKAMRIYKINPEQSEAHRLLAEDLTGYCTALVNDLCKLQRARLRLEKAA